jgi:hypothetical protein
LLSTLLAPDPAPAIDRGWYYGVEHGQHISLYRTKKLRYLAQTRGLHVCTNGRNLHLFSRKPIANWRFNVCVATGYVGLSELLRPLVKSKTLSDAERIGGAK